MAYLSLLFSLKDYVVLVEFDVVISKDTSAVKKKKKGITSGFDRNHTEEMKTHSGGSVFCCQVHRMIIPIIVKYSDTLFVHITSFKFL